MLQYDDGYRSDIFIPLSPLSGPYTEADAEKGVLHIVSVDGKVKPVLVDGLELLERQHTALFRNGAPSVLLSRVEDDIKAFAEGHGMQCALTTLGSYRRWNEIYDWRSKGIGSVSNASCHGIYCGSDELIAVCGRYADSPVFKNFCGMLQKDLHKALGDKAVSFKDMEKKIGDTIGKIKDMYPEFNVMRMNRNEYAVQESYIEFARICKAQEDDRFFMERLGLTKGDSYVLFLQDKKNRQNVFLVKESQIAKADTLEEAVSWYAFGKDALDMYFGVDDGMGGKDYVVSDKADCYRLGNGRTETVHPKDALKDLDTAFYRNWEFTLEMTVRERKMTVQKYFADKMYEKDMANGIFHAKGQCSLKRKPASRSREIGNERR